MRILVICSRCKEECIKHRHSIIIIAPDKKPFYLCGSCSDEMTMLRHARMVRKLHDSIFRKRESQRRNVAAFKLQHPEATTDEKRTRVATQRK